MRVSIITVNYNNRAGLQKTIKSVLGQTYEDLEYIIIDGGSTDGSLEEIRQHSDKLSYWVSEKDSGIYNAMNKGVLHASGNYVIFMNSGDCFFSDDVLERVYPFLDCDIVCGDALLGYGAIWRAPSCLDEGFLLNRSSICHQSTFVKTQLLRENPYNEAFRIVADYCFLVYEMLVNHRTYRNTDITVCRYECSGVSSDDKLADMEKIKVLDYLRYNGYIVEDSLVHMCKSLKPLGRKYKLVHTLLKVFVAIEVFSMKQI